jgi:ATP-binding cassette, subfamily B, bacterial PglK
MRTHLKQCVAMVPREMRWQWAAVLPLILLTAATESVGAAAVYALVKIVADPSRVAEIPVVATIAARLPWHDPVSVVTVFAALAALFYVLKNAFLIWVSVTRSKIESRSVAVLASRMFKGYLTVPYAFHFRRNSADLIRQTNDSVRMMFGVLSSTATVTSEMLVTLGFVAVLLRAAPGVTLIAGAFLTVLLAVLLKVTRRHAIRLGSQAHHLGMAVVQSVQQGLGAIKEIKVLGREPYFHAVYADGQAELARLQAARAMLDAMPRLATETAFMLGALIVVVLMTWRGGIGSDVTPLLGLYGYAALRLVPSANRMQWYLSEIRYFSTAVDQLYQDFLFVTRQPAVDRDAPAERGRGFSALALDGVGYTYDGTETRVLDDIRVTIRCGESIGVVGPTGAGKTTLVDLIVGLLTPSAGRITIDGIDLSRRLSWWQRQIGYVPQEVYLVDDSLRRNIALGIPDAEIDDPRVRAAVRMARLDELAASLPEGLGTFVGERGIRLSGGQRQRVGIARALYHQPDVLIFDEATSSLDNATEAEVTKAIEALHGMKTLVVIAHRLTTVRHCDRLVFLENGRVAACGTFEELMQNSAEFRRMAMPDAAHAERIA